MTPRSLFSNVVDNSNSNISNNCNIRDGNTTIGTDDKTDAAIRSKEARVRMKAKAARNYVDELQRSGRLTPEQSSTLHEYISSRIIAMMLMVSLGNVPPVTAEHR